MTKRAKPKEFVFHINGFSVDTMPMNKLAGYVTDLAALLGEQGSVHLAAIESGSVAFRVSVDPVAEPKVRNRIREYNLNQGNSETRDAIHRLNKRLADDKTSATLFDSRNRNIIEFPGVVRSEKMGPFRQAGTVDGIPVRVGGIRRDVTVHLQQLDNHVQICSVSREMAKDIAKHLFQSPIRAEGQGTWYRWPDGKWEMDSFIIQGFKPLRDDNFDLIVQRLRLIDLPLEQDEDLVDAMASIRNG